MTAVAGPAGARVAGMSARSWLGFGAVAGAVLLADQASKALVLGAVVPDGLPVTVIGDLVRVTLTANDGGIFGLLGASALPLALASLVVIAVIIAVQARQGAGDRWLTLALGLLLGGALGNLIDRLRFGWVTDFVDIGIGDLRWYTFNVADAAISLAIVILLARSLTGMRRPGAGGGA